MPVHVQSRAVEAHDAQVERPATYLGLVRRAFAQVGDGAGLRYYDSASSSRFRGYSELERRARTIGDALRSEGFGPGDVAIIAFEQGLAWVDAVFGVLFAGLAFAPAPIVSANIPASQAETVRRMAASVDARILITDRASVTALGVMAQDGVRILAVEDLMDSGDPEHWSEPAVDGDSLGFFMFTSGSTGAPKGIPVTQRTMVDMVEVCSEIYAISADSVVVGWLPLHNGFGVCVEVLVPAALGSQTVVTPTALFQRRPLSWLQLITEHRGTVSAAGNFAFDLCTQFVTDEQLAQLDLSSLQVLVSGSEPVRAATVNAFIERFAPAGVTESMIMPVFGMSEAMAVCGKPVGAPMVIGHFDVSAMEAGRLEPSEEPDAIEIVSCGRAIDSVKLLIVDPDTLQPLPDGRIGELLVATPALASGYYKQPEETAAVFGTKVAGDDRDYLRTGDLAAILGGELFIAGRRKEVIIIRGRNIFPQDLESAARELSTVVGVAAAFELQGHPSSVGIVAEYDADALLESSESLETVAGRLRDGLLARFSLPSLAVALVPKGALPRTPTGKVQRRPTRIALESGNLLPDIARGFAEVARGSAES